MSPGLALRQVGSRESSSGGLCRAGLARREVRRTASRWARIAQAGPGPRRLGPHRLRSPWNSARTAPGPARVCRVRADSGPGISLSGPGFTQAGPSPRRPDPRRCGVGRTDLGAVVDPVPVPFHPAPAGSARSSLNPRARTSSRRARGLPGDLADRGDGFRGAAGTLPWGPDPREAAPDHLLRPFTLCYAPFSRTVKGEGA